MSKVFLGGTTNESTWRDIVISQLKMEYYNPVVPDWTLACQEEEIRQRGICDFILYVLTPKMAGFYVIAEAVDDSNKQPDKTIFCYLIQDGNARFNDWQIYSLNAVSKMIKTNGATICNSLEGCIDTLNRKA